MVNGLLMTMVLLGTEKAGLAEYAFDYEVSGNPYDAGENDVRVVFGNGDRRYERLAFYDGRRWRARIRAEVGTPFRTSVVVNGRMLSMTGRVEAQAKTEPAGGIVRVSRTEKTKFVDEKGSAYFPLGCNLGWQNGSEPSIPEQFRRMAGAGMNWSRVWSNHWDGKNPFWIEGQEKIDEGWMYPAALDRWDEVIKGAEMNGMRIQFVLFHHGPWSVDVNSNWDANPWNAANGGFLKEPREFFTHAKAKRHSQNWLRYAVARWGHSGAVLAWELFNEVEWTQPPRQDQDWGPVVAWHKEMAAYLRSIDPDRHMVTTSSPYETPEMWSAMDYYQPHGYPTSVKSMMKGMEVHGDKPVFYGEFGPGNFDGSHRMAVREGLWASVLAGHHGAGAYWFWDRLLSEPDLYTEFRTMRAVLDAAPWISAQKGRRMTLSAETATKATRLLRPARGWAKTEAFEVDLTTGDGSEAMGKVSSYFNSQSGGNRSLFPEPLVIRYESASPSALTVRVVSVAEGGATATVRLDGTEVSSKSWKGNSLTSQAPDFLRVDLPAGRHSIEIASTGADWFQVAEIGLAQMAPNIEPMGLGTDREAVVWLRKLDVGLDEPAALGGLGLGDGRYVAHVWDLNTGEMRMETVEVRGGRAEGIRLASPDEVWLMRR